jgi:hypothetical protein
MLSCIDQGCCGDLGILMPLHLLASMVSHTAEESCFRILNGLMGFYFIGGIYV